jgi:hypothetical protein
VAYTMFVKVLDCREDFLHKVAGLGLGELVHLNNFLK